MNIRIALTALVLSLLVACANEPSQNEDLNKYVFDNLQEVKKVNNWRIDGWNVIDNQSLIIHTSPTTSYLLILSRPDHNIKFSEAVLVSSTAGSVQSGFDTVSTPRGGTMKTPIKRIYKLQGKEQQQQVKAQILGEKPGE